MDIAVESLESFSLVSIVSIIELVPDVLLLVKFVLSPESSFGITVLSPLIFQRGQLSFEFLVVRACIGLRE